MEAWLTFEELMYGAAVSPESFPLGKLCGREGVVCGLGPIGKDSGSGAGFFPTNPRGSILIWDCAGTFWEVGVLSSWVFEFGG